MIASRLGKGKIISMLKLDTIQKEKEENLQLKVQKIEQATQKEKYLSLPHRGNHHGNRYCNCMLLLK
jgi:hypothetical protein